MAERVRELRFERETRTLVAPASAIATPCEFGTNRDRFFFVHHARRITTESGVTAPPPWWCQAGTVNSFLFKSVNCIFGPKNYDYTILIP